MSTYTNKKKSTEEEELKGAKKYSYNAQKNTAYRNALSALDKAKAEKPTYAGTYEKELESVYGSIKNREPFRYELNSDPFYRQYEDRYTTLGQRAMRDTVGQAAALTGGYGNTYAESAGQQQYGAYLEKLFDLTPGLYGMALDRYNAEGDALYDRMSWLGTMADREYAQYGDALSAYWQNVNALQSAADTAYDRGYRDWNDALDRAAADERFQYQQTQDAAQAEQEADRLAYEREADAYNRQWNEQKWLYEQEQDALDRADRDRAQAAADEEAAYERQVGRFNTLSALISKTGYSPTDEELEMAGMTRPIADAYRSLFTGNAAGGSTGSKSGSGGSKKSTKKKDDTPFTGSTSGEAKQYLLERGISADGIVSEYTFNSKRAQYLQNPGRSDLGNPKDKNDMWAYYKDYGSYIRDYVNSLSK